eukprot:TRINITY_DN8045_c0_g1_i1.p2 TRINITY_DN8045_c0_g1~~TRINITY_DN8045_c0_g1_i1.p2  ORF type:complete len:106 (-),score=8.95 TRINITY_DN8045_c0_g1_i1:615-932(-)
MHFCISIQSSQNLFIETLFVVPPLISILYRISYPRSTNNGSSLLLNNWADFLDFMKGEENELELFEKHNPNLDTESEQGFGNCIQIHTSQLSPPLISSLNKPLLP